MDNLDKLNKSFILFNNANDEQSIKAYLDKTHFNDKYFEAEIRYRKILNKLGAPPNKQSDTMLSRLHRSAKNCAELAISNFLRDEGSVEDLDLALNDIANGYTIGRNVINTKEEDNNYLEKTNEKTSMNCMTFAGRKMRLKATVRFVLPSFLLLPSLYVHLIL